MTNSLDINEEQYLLLDPHTFDQDKVKGRRGVLQSGIKDFILSLGRDTKSYEKSLTIMEKYLKKHDFSQDLQRYKDLLQFHIGQLYASMGDYKRALNNFEHLQSMGYKHVGTYYLDATVFFLQRDKDGVRKVRESIMSEKDEINYDKIQSFMENFDMSYIEAYEGHGMTIEEMRDEWLKVNKI